ncbi:MAG: aldo/keto reductase [Candidatus Heimdallarchaeota archaeon]|nr:aldo/keto reductase [Candidatus Heimdallarchaeota archaeon]
MSYINLPKIGLGTMQANSKKARGALVEGLKYGFRFIDTAQMYFNEKTVGLAIKESGISRDEFTVATKLWISNYKPEKVLRSVKRSLKRLQLETIDIFYLHWPWKFDKIESTFKAMDKLVEKGAIKNIGVSNFTPKQIEKSLTFTQNHIVANQVEMHPWLQQKELLTTLKKNKIHLVAYFPLMHGKFNNVPELLQIAKKHNVNPAQVSLAWIMSKDAIPIPKSANVEHLKSNFDSLKLKLAKDEIKLIDSIETVKRYANFPIIAPDWEN